MLTINGSLSLEGDTLTATKGLSGQGADGSGPGTVNVGQDGGIVLNKTATISNLLINLAGDNAYLQHNESDANDYAANGGALTLAANTKVVSTGAQTSITSSGYWDGAIVNNGEIDVVSGDLTIAPGIFVNNGAIDVLGGGLSIAYNTQFSNYGTVAITNAQCAVGAVTGAGGFVLNDNARLVVTGANAGGTIAFNASTATLEIGYGVQVDAVISGFGRGDRIVVDGRITDAVYNSGDGTLKLYNDGGLVETLTLSGASYTFDLFTVTSNGSGSVITELPNAATVDQYLANKAAFDALAGGFVLLDAAANIAAHLAQLDNPAISSIGIADNAALSVSVAQLADATAALAKLQNQDQTSYKLLVSGAAADIEAGLSTLAANLDHIVSIALTDSGPAVVTLSIAQATDGAAALAKITTPHTLAIADVSANVASLTADRIAALASQGVTTISVTDQLVALNRTQRTAFGAAHVALQEPYSGGSYQIVDFNDDGSVREIQRFGVANRKWDATETIFGANGKPVQQTATVGAGHDVVYIKDYNADGVAVHMIRTSLSGAASETWYNDAGKRTRQLSANGVATVYSYDANNVLTETVQSGVTGRKWDTLDTRYVAGGKTLTATLGGALVYQRDYDAAGVLTHSITTALYGSASEIWYSAGSKSVSQVAEDGATTLYTYDANNVLVEARVSAIPGQAYDATAAIFVNGKVVSETWTKQGVVWQTESWDASGAVADVHNYVSGAFQGVSYTSVDHLYAAGLKTADVYLSSDGATLARQDYASNGGWTISVGGLVKTKLANANGSSEIRTTGITGQKYNETDVFYDASGKGVSEAWLSNGVVTAIKNWNPDGTVNSVESGARSSVDLLAFDPASTTLGYSENAGGGGVLTLSQGAEYLSFALLGQFSAADFALTPGSAGGVTVSAQNGQTVFLAAHA